METGVESGAGVGASAENRQDRAVTVRQAERGRQDWTAHWLLRFRGYRVLKQGHKPIFMIVKP